MKNAMLGTQIETRTHTPKKKHELFRTRSSHDEILFIALRFLVQIVGVCVLEFFGNS